ASVPGLRAHGRSGVSGRGRHRVDTAQYEVQRADGCGRGFSRSRGRYERQGILAEPEAIQKAEHECTQDGDTRATARAAAAVVREKEDRELVSRMTERIRGLFPGIAANEAAAIAKHTATRGSGRVGRTAAGRNLEEGPLAAAVRAAVRHNRTRYDELLAEGVDSNSRGSGCRMR